jgi:hypothetical protein
MLLKLQRRRAQNGTEKEKPGIRCRALFQDRFPLRQVLSHQTGLRPY